MRRSLFLLTLFQVAIYLIYLEQLSIPLCRRVHGRHECFPLQQGISGHRHLLYDSDISCSGHNAYFQEISIQLQAHQVHYFEHQILFVQQLEHYHKLPSLAQPLMPAVQVFLGLPLPASFGIRADNP